MSFRIIIDARTSDAQYVGQSEMQSSEITKKQNNLLWHSSFDSVSMLKPQGELIHRHESGSGTEGQSMQDVSGVCSDRHSQRALNEGGRSTGRGYIQRTAGDRARQGHLLVKSAQYLQPHSGNRYSSASGAHDLKKTRVISGISSKIVGNVNIHRTLDAAHNTTLASAGRIEEGTSLLNSFTPTQVHAHLQSLKMGLRLSSAKIRQKCAPVLKKLTDHECSWIFMQPVDPVELNLPDYFDVVKTPMDLGSIKKRMENNCYKSILDFAADVRLTFDNAVTYNGDGSDVCKVAREMKLTFEKLYQVMIATIEAEEKQRKLNGDVCILCGCEKLLFEPTVYYCNGSCNGQRIRRNSYYYTGGRNQYHWCQQCFNELRDKQPLEFADCTLWKKDLQKKKNDEMHEEPWVECARSATGGFIKYAPCLMVG